MIGDSVTKDAMEGLLGCCWWWMIESVKMDVVAIGFVMASDVDRGGRMVGNPRLIVGCSASLARR